MSAYAAALRSVIRRMGRPATRLTLTAASRNSSTGDARYSAQRETVIVAMWPDNPTSRRGMDISTQMLLKDGGRFSWAATLNGHTWEANDRLEQDKTTYVVRWVGRYETHTELLLEVAK